MKKIYAVVLVVLMSGLAIAETGITVTETHLGNGDSTIRVINSISGIDKTYNINMSTHHYPATSPDDPVVQKYESWKFGAFLCYNSNQYSGTEFCSSTDPVNDFDPTNLDVEQWITTIKNAGMKYAVLTVRHTSEFLLWDSVTSEINVMNSSYQNDLVQEYVDQCRQQGIAVGIYYCLWGGQGWRPDPNARAIILAQLHELLRHEKTVRIEKTYLALLDGQWSGGSRTINIGISKIKRSGEHMMQTDEYGDHAISHFKPLKIFEHCSLMKHGRQGPTHDAEKGGPAEM